MSVTFRSQLLNDLYSGTTTVFSGANASALDAFRTGGATDLDDAIAALDARIASFESVLIGPIGSGLNSADYPYDRAGLRREFLDEVLALLMRRSVTGNTIDNTYTDPRTPADTTIPATQYNTLGFSVGTGGGVQVVVNKLAAGTGDFANLTPSVTHATIASDGRLGLLNPAGYAIFVSYSNLIDQVFAEGDKLGDNPARATENVSAISALTVAGLTYNRVAQVSGYDPLTKLPTFATFLLEDTAERSRVVKDLATGDVSLTPDTLLISPTSSAAQRLELEPVPATVVSSTPPTYLANVNGVFVSVRVTTAGIELTDGGGPYIPTTEIAALNLNIPERGNEFPDARIVANARATAANGITYLVGLGSDGKVYVTSLAPAQRSSVGTIANLNALEYLLFFNEARIKILRAKLAYNEAVVREVQEDLRQANEALAELETQAGSIVATNADSTLSGQTSSETFGMSLFAATHSKANDPIFSTAGNDSLNISSEWQQNRTKLKNYIDQRSSEAQQATLDYQNTLNRFNNAFEVMAKLQEKIDTLLKAQLRNL